MVVLKDRIGELVGICFSLLPVEKQVVHVGSFVCRIDDFSFSFWPEEMAPQEYSTEVSGRHVLDLHSADLSIVRNGRKRTFSEGWIRQRRIEDSLYKTLPKNGDAYPYIEYEWSGEQGREGILSSLNLYVGDKLGGTIDDYSHMAYRYNREEKRWFGNRCGSMGGGCWNALGTLPQTLDGVSELMGVPLPPRNIDFNEEAKRIFCLSGLEEFAAVLQQNLAL